MFTGSVEVRSAKAHARVTNNLRELDGIDGRTSEGKRYRDLIDLAVAEFGSHDPLRLRELAGLRFSLEKTQAAVVNGDILRSEDLVRLANLIGRREKELRAAQRRAAAVAGPGPTVGLRDRLGDKYGGAP